MLILLNNKITQSQGGNRGAQILDKDTGSLLLNPKF